MVLPLALSLLAGFLAGKLLPRFPGRSLWTMRAQNALLALMLVVLGARLGLIQSRMQHWLHIFAQSLALAAGSVAGSLAFVFPLRRLLAPESEETIRSQSAHLPEPPKPHQIIGMSLAALAAGVVLGVTVLAGRVDYEQLRNPAFALLCSILVLVALEVATDDEASENLEGLSPVLALVPLAIALGSVCGGGLAGWLMGFRLREGAAVGAGCGWYSLTSIILGQKAGAAVGSFGLLANLFRETLSFLVIPLVARYHHGLLLLAAPGCTAMDTTLPILGRLGGNKIGVMAFLTGAVLSLLVPLLVPWTWQLLS